MTKFVAQRGGTNPREVVKTKEKNRKKFFTAFIKERREEDNYTAPNSNCQQDS
jgi:hypothetical protein